MVEQPGDTPVTNDDRVIDTDVVIFETDVCREPATEVCDPGLELDQPRAVTLGNRNVRPAVPSPVPYRARMAASLGGHTHIAARLRHAKVNLR
jgi:hypothetical protein